MNKLADPTPGDLFAKRVNEALPYFLGQSPATNLPDWVLKIAKKLWSQALPPRTPLPTDDEKDSVRWGIILAFWKSGKVSSPHETNTQQVLKNADHAGLGTEVRTMIGRLESGESAENMLSKDQLGERLIDFMGQPDKQRIAFANGLLVGTKLRRAMKEPDFLAHGGPRQMVLLAMWLNWEQLDSMPTVAGAYRQLSKIFAASGQADVLGDWERFKKIAQSVEFRGRRRRKGKSKA